VAWLKSACALIACPLLVEMPPKSHYIYLVKKVAHEYKTRAHLQCVERQLRPSGHALQQRRGEGAK
jgi:hypothetical protein